MHIQKDRARSRFEDRVHHLTYGSSVHIDYHPFFLWLSYTRLRYYISSTFTTIRSDIVQDQHGAKQKAPRVQLYYPKGSAITCFPNTSLPYTINTWSQSLITPPSDFTLGERAYMREAILLYNACRLLEVDDNTLISNVEEEAMLQHFFSKQWHTRKRVGDHPSFRGALS
jgi:hypothetical protein